MWFKLVCYLLLGIAILSMLYSFFVKKYRLRLALRCIGVLCLIGTATLSQIPLTFASIHDAFHFMAHGNIIHIIDAPHSACIIYESSPTETSNMVVSKVPGGYTSKSATVHVATDFAAHYAVKILCDQTKTDYFASGFYVTEAADGFEVTDSLGSAFTYSKEPLGSYYIVTFYAYLSAYDSSYSFTISNHAGDDITIFPELP